MIFKKPIDDKTLNARKFAQEVQELSKKYNLPFFFVTYGASATSNNGNEAVRNARESHIKWEKKNKIDPNHDWLKDKKFKRRK